MQNEYDLFKDYPDIVNITDIQKMLKIGRNNTYELLKSGKIHTLRVGKKYIIPKQSVIDFVKTACNL